MKNNIAIRLENISKRYTIHHEKPTLVERLAKGKDEEFRALENINLTVRKGEKVGIIGPNGSGKTTLLKIIAGITTPTGGTIETYGRIVSLIDLEAGFHPDLTGEQNIFLNGMLLGLNKNDIRRKIDAIIDFADIKQFIDIPLFTYSDGMRLRLGFAIAVYANPDILILDEGISIGDRNFQIKSEHAIGEILRRGKTILVSTHILWFIEQCCRRVLILKNGVVAKDGSIGLIKQYKKDYP